MTTLLMWKLVKDQAKALFELTNTKNVGRQLSKIRNEPVSPATPGATGSYTVEAVSVDFQVGCVLFQRKLDGSDVPYDHWYRTLNGNKKKLLKSFKVYRSCMGRIIT